MSGSSARRLVNGDGIRTVNGVPTTTTTTTARRSDGPQPKRHFCHCGHSFIRKEHLRRHYATHLEPAFVCNECKKSFTRNDLLRRHMTLHGKEVSGPRIKRACDACHQNKTRCDGGSQCSLCTKRGVRCAYTQRPGNPRSLTSGSEMSDDDVDGASGHAGESRSGARSSANDTPEDRPPRTSSHMDISFIQDSAPPPVLETRAMLDAQSALGAALRATARLRVEGARLEEVNTDALRKAAKRCWNAFAEKFHLHWQFLHGPSFDVETAPLVQAVVVIMIGAWLEAPGQSLIGDVHGQLLEFFLSELGSELQSFHPRRKWPLDALEACLLLLIFTYRYSKSLVSSKTELLRAVFTSLLRQIGFFTSETAKHQEDTHWPGPFVPYRFVQRERRIQFLSSLWRLDTWISIERQQHPTLELSHMDCGLPSSFALWNTYGLQTWYRRLTKEPPIRAQMRITSADAVAPGMPSSNMLVEDAQLGLASLWPRIWRAMQNDAAADEADRAELRADLESCRSRLDRAAGLCREQFDQGRHEDFPLAAYLGDEDDGKFYASNAAARVGALAEEGERMYFALKRYLEKAV